MTMTEDGNMFIALGSKTRHLLLLNIREERKWKNVNVKVDDKQDIRRNNYCSRLHDKGNCHQVLLIRIVMISGNDPNELLMVLQTWISRKYLFAHCNMIIFNIEDFHGTFPKHRENANKLKLFPKIIRRAPISWRIWKILYYERRIRAGTSLLLIQRIPIFQKLLPANIYALSYTLPKPIIHAHDTNTWTNR